MTGPQQSPDAERDPLEAPEVLFPAGKRTVKVNGVGSDIQLYHFVSCPVSCIGKVDIHVYPVSGGNGGRAADPD